MYIVIQPIQLKKPNKNGAYKRHKVSTVSFNSNGIIKTHYSYFPDYEFGRFERPRKDAYKISVHQSYRENGQVKKKQCVICTISFYDIVGSLFALYDYVETGLNNAAKMFNLSDDYPLYDIIEEKLRPLQKQLIEEYICTEEYEAVKQHDQVLKEYRSAKAKFAADYGVDQNEYDYCYNVFGELMDKDYLDIIIKQHESRSYYSKQSSNHSYSSNSGQYGSYQNLKSSNYNDDQKKMLKQFYKSLSMKFHPDMNLDTDTTKEMQLLNQLKDDWGL